MATKNKLLLCLKEQKGEWISGQSISNRLSVSRTAIWKHVGKLKADGYVIESSPKKGYLLVKVPDLLIADEIQEKLNTSVFGKKDIIYFRETDSTNTRAKDLASNGAPEGTVVVAEKQTKGRGRRGRDWFSPFGDGIYASLILRPAISPVKAPKITLMAAVAVAESLLSLTQLDVRIKWPNDILINGKKIAGILTEISTEMDRVNYIVVGLGLNVNTSFKSSTEEVKKRATSILVETGKPFSRIKLVQAYLQFYEKYYEMFNENGFEPIMSRWKELANIVGQRIVVDIIGKKYIGKVLDVDDDGILILKDNQGTIHRIFSGDVAFASNNSSFAPFNLSKTLDGKG
ncbi:MAG: biotin--[acetyl-CoA-carboxylase] ligase [Deltaproteobacteria bacterium]|nr:biotin--[acetyl-CoA-carboxylase] ligase [Deltaproteobacteria bacterium]MBW2660763.1 biotin--[acetyl-CoA-carboxylase] ligase [Deltaproteobacteria bacterium]